MKPTLPVYFSRIHSDNKTHISVGTEVETLCGETKIKGANQISGTTKPKNVDVDLCEDCVKKWLRLKEHMVMEATPNCEICNQPYSAPRLRIVEYLGDEFKSVCQPCYVTLLESDASAVSLPYEDAEPFDQKPNSRKFYDHFPDGIP